MENRAAGTSTVCHTRLPYAIDVGVSDPQATNRMPTESHAIDAGGLSEQLSQSFNQWAAVPFQAQGKLAQRDGLFRRQGSDEAEMGFLGAELFIEGGS